MPNQDSFAMSLENFDQPSYLSARIKVVWLFVAFSLANKYDSLHTCTGSSNGCTFLALSRVACIGHETVGGRTPSALRD
eukprot:2422534-Amphidinium_carterae.1